MLKKIFRNWGNINHKNRGFKMKNKGVLKKGLCLMLAAIFTVTTVAQAAPSVRPGHNHLRPAAAARAESRDALIGRLNSFPKLINENFLLEPELRQEDTFDESSFSPQGTKPEIFKRDIRAEAEQLSNEVSYYIGRSFATLLKETLSEEEEIWIVVGGDVRKSTPHIYHHLTEGLLDSGINIIHVGITTTPAIYFSIPLLEAHGFVDITGSHNPPADNGIKAGIGPLNLNGKQANRQKEIFFSKSYCAKVSREQKGKVIDRSLILRSGYIDFLKAYILASPQEWQQHIIGATGDRLREGVKKILEDHQGEKPLKGKRIAVDCGNGTAADLPLFWQDLGAEVGLLYPEYDGDFPHHIPNPEDPDNLKDLIDFVKKGGYEMGFAFDTDVDRIGAVTPNNIVSGEDVLCIIAEDALGKHPEATVVVEIKSSYTLIDHIERLGGKTARSKTGYTHVKKLISDRGAILGGEVSAHIFARDNDFRDDALFTATTLLKIMSEKNKTFPELLSNIHYYYTSPEFRLNLKEGGKNKEKIIENLRTIYRSSANCEIDELDGIRIQFNNPRGEWSSWFLVRASDTEPKLSVRFEGRNESDFNHVAKEVFKFLTASDAVDFGKFRNIVEGILSGTSVVKLIDIPGLGTKSSSAGEDFGIPAITGEKGVSGQLLTNLRQGYKRALEMMGAIYGDKAVTVLKAIPTIQIIKRDMIGVAQLTPGRIKLDFDTLVSAERVIGELLEEFIHSVDKPQTIEERALNELMTDIMQIQYFLALSKEGQASYMYSLIVNADISVNDMGKQFYAVLMASYKDKEPMEEMLKVLKDAYSVADEKLNILKKIFDGKEQKPDIFSLAWNYGAQNGIHDADITSYIAENKDYVRKTIEGSETVSLEVIEPLIYMKYLKRNLPSARFYGLSLVMGLPLRGPIVEIAKKIQQVIKEVVGEDRISLYDEEKQSHSTITAVIRTDSSGSPIQDFTWSDSKGDHEVNPNGIIDAVSSVGSKKGATKQIEMVFNTISINTKGEIVIHGKVIDEHQEKYNEMIEQLKASDVNARKGEKVHTMIGYITGGLSPKERQEIVRGVEKIKNEHGNLGVAVADGAHLVHYGHRGMYDVPFSVDLKFGDKTNNNKYKGQVAKLLNLAGPTSGTKSSSAGEDFGIPAITGELETTTASFTSTEMLPSLNPEALTETISTYQKTIEKLKALKTSAEAAAAVAEPLEKAEASLDTMSLSKDVAGEIVKTQEVSGTIIVNDAEIPANQKILLTLLDKESGYLKALEEKLGCKVRLLSQFNPETDTSANMIAISKERIDTIPNSRYLDIQAVTEDMYLPLEQIIVFAKGLLVYGIDKSDLTKNIISQMYKILTKTPMAKQILEDFINTSVFTLALPMPVPVNEKYYEQLHMQAMAALIAA